MNLFEMSVSANIRLKFTLAMTLLDDPFVEFRFLMLQFAIAVSLSRAMT